MNYLKRIGRLVAICICAVCVGIIPITAHAMEVSDKQIQPRMPANIVWNDLGIQIRAGSYHEFNCNLNLFGNFDEDEKYRITKKVYVNQKEYTLYADFTVN